MRNRLVATFAALLLASANLAQAQTPPTKPSPPDVPSQGLFDVGVRFGDVDGDEARFERYRDLRPGAAALLDWTKNTEQYRFNFGASNIGYRDQRYAADYNTGKLTVSGVYDSIPLNYLYDAPYWLTGDGNGRFTLDPAVRQRIQGPTNAAPDGTAVGVPCAPGSGPTTCNASTSAAAQAYRSIYNMAVLTISGFPLAFTPTTKGTTMVGSRIPAITIRMMISMSVKPFFPIADCGSRIAE